MAAEEAVNALGWVHSLAVVEPPSSSPFVRATLEGVQRMLARPDQKKEPITSEILAKLVADTNRDSSLANLSLKSACLLAYVGFLRFHVTSKKIAPW